MNLTGHHPKPVAGSGAEGLRQETSKYLRIVQFVKHLFFLLGGRVIETADINGNSLRYDWYIFEKQWSAKNAWCFWSFWLRRKKGLNKTLGEKILVKEPEVDRTLRIKVWDLWLISKCLNLFDLIRTELFLFLFLLHYLTLLLYYELQTIFSNIWGAMVVVYIKLIPLF